MTSNIGSQSIMELAEGRALSGEGLDKEINRRVMEALRREFLPEFLNRVDEVIVFHPLGRAEIRQIVDLQLRRLSKQLEENGFGFEISDAAKDQLGEEGYDPAYGARPLKRVIQQRLQNELANELLSGRLPQGCKIVVDVKDGEFQFSHLT